MTQKLCPQGHRHVIRNDPDSEGFLAQCDTCGWSAPFVVIRDEAEFVERPDEPDRDRERLAEENRTRERAQLPRPTYSEQDQQRFAADEQTRRRGD